MESVLRFLGSNFAWSTAYATNKKDCSIQINEEQLFQFKEYNKKNLIKELKKKNVEFSFEKDVLLIKKWVYEKFYY